MREAARPFNLTTDLKEVTPPDTGAPATARLPNYIITLHGEDQTGIVYRTAKLLSGMGVNITDLETKAAHRSGRERDLYMMVLEVYVPAEVDPEALGERLKALAGDLGIRIRLKPVEDYGAL